MRTAYLLPLTAFCLLLAVAALGLRAGRHRGYGALAVGVVAAVLLILGKFILDSNVAVYGAIAALVGASLWNSWPATLKMGVPLAPMGTLYQIGGTGKEKDMAAKRKIEVFSAGCPACQETVALVQSVACPSCEMTVLDVNDANVARQAKALGIRSVPAVAIDGKLADCCQGRGPDEAVLRAAGLGQAVT